MTTYFACLFFECFSEFRYSFTVHFHAYDVIWNWIWRDHFNVYWVSIRWHVLLHYLRNAQNNHIPDNADSLSKDFGIGKDFKYFGTVSFTNATNASILNLLNFRLKSRAISRSGSDVIDPGNFAPLPENPVAELFLGPSAIEK